MKVAERGYNISRVGVPYSLSAVLQRHWARECFIWLTSENYLERRAGWWTPGNGSTFIYSFTDKKLCVSELHETCPGTSPLFTSASPPPRLGTTPRYLEIFCYSGSPACSTQSGCNISLPLSLSISFLLSTLFCFSSIRAESVGMSSCWSPPGLNLILHFLLLMMEK